MSNTGFILEVQKIGSIVRVSATDPITLVEVILQMPAKTTRLSMERAAARKLERAIVRHKKRQVERATKKDRINRLI